MFVKFNYDNFTNVHVTFGKLNSNEDFNIKYSFKMSAFIKRLKRQPVQYLQRSIIIVNNSFIQSLLDLIFFIQSPVAPVYIIKDINYVQKILDNSLNDIEYKYIY